MARDRVALRFFWFERGTWARPVNALGDLTDRAGFDSPSQYRTIRTGEVTSAGAFDVVARTRTGITTWGLRRDPQFGYDFTKLSDGPALTGPAWDDPSHYDTIGLGDITGHGTEALVVRGVFGIRTFVWHGGAFGRPHRYGEFPAFPDTETRAYAEVSQLLLHRVGDFRKLTYASPNEAITEGELNDYRSRLAERCTPLAAKRKPAAKHKPAAKRKVGGPPRYTDCKPPAEGVNQAAWTAVSNQIIAELWAASGVVAHFTILEGIETKLFQDKQGTLPALDAELALPPNPPDRSPTFLKLTKGSLDILKTLVEFFPVAGKLPRHLRAVALTGHALGAIADGLSLSSSPSPPAPYGQIVGEVASSSSNFKGDITQAQRRYVLADYGLSMTVGAEVKGRLLTLDQTAALSAGRQAFAIWVTQLYLPAYWRRYHVTGCRNDVGLTCAVPAGSFVRVTGQNQFGTNFEAALVGGSTCVRRTIPGGFTRVTCMWGSPAGATYSRLVDPVPKECRYDPTPGSIAAWRYGCPYGVPASELIDGTNGWNLRSPAARPTRAAAPMRSEPNVPAAVISGACIGPSAHRAERPGVRQPHAGDAVQAHLRHR